MIELLESLAQSPAAIYVAENGNVFPWAETFHVMAITLVFGTILIVDLRLMGLAANSLRVSSLTKSMLPITWSAFAVAVVTGAIMFLSNPVGYYENTAFRIKVFMLLAAGMNMALFHLFTARSIAGWDEPNARLPGAARTAGILSVSTWVTIIAAGRWIGFTISPF
jgi:hypothetical protein